MDVQEIEKKLGRFNPALVAAALKLIKSIPVFRKIIEEMVMKEAASMMGGIEPSLKPYREEFESFSALPGKGRPRNEILNTMEKLKSREESKWKKGFVSGAVYHGDPAHIDFMNRVYALNSQTNPLHSDVWPSITKYEAEIVSMTARMLGAEQAGPDATKICGTVTSGGTESILLAMKTYRDQARDRRGVTRPEMIAPDTAHAAFDKAAEYFNIKIIRIPVDKDFRADVAAARRAVTRRTVVIIGSAPTFPHGVVDPIAELSELAREKRIGFHTDACLGGFILPWLGKIGYDIPPFDFRLPGVTSISADTHKYGYAAKGSSVVLYRDPALRHYQFFNATEWPGGLYFSPTFAGSRPGALSATCWAAMISLGEQGYIEAARKIMLTAEKIKKGIRGIPELGFMGDPLWVIAFGSAELDVFRVMDSMTARGWSLNGLQKPSCVHICITLRHTRPGIAERFIKDLKDAVRYVKAHPGKKGGMAPVYGMAASFPDRGAVSDILDVYLDTLYKV